MHIGISRSLALAAVSLLAACSGNYDGGTAGEAANPTGPQQFANAAQFFSARVEPVLAYCATCHVDGGVADTAEGERMLLSSDRSQDQANLRSSWEAMGRNNPVSRILLMASGQGDPHSGGAPWPQDSAAYRDVSAMLACFENPDQCMSRIAAAGGGTAGEQKPLLGSSRGRSTHEIFCEGLDGNTPQPASAALPVDARELVTPGANANKAVFFNAYWEDCHAQRPETEQKPRTCGEYREKRDLGRHMLREGFAQDTGAVMDATTFANQWQSWGLAERPADFDEMYRLRTGMAKADYDNPYPLPGEDPNAAGVNGGSGELPLGFRQLKDAQGNWTGQIGSEGCASCHAGDIPTGEAGVELRGMYGLGSANSDDPSLQRGHSDAVTGFEILWLTLRDWDSLDRRPPNIANYAATHLPSRQDTPAWWNTGHRPRKFFDGGPSVDSHRIVNSAAAGPGTTGAELRAYMDEYGWPLSLALESIESPEYPGNIDTALAEQGAVLFHAKNLWLEAGNASRPRPPGGNGSCASCHGAYSPRFVNDTAYLDSPALEGIASYIAPIAVIGTDRIRLDQLSGIFADVWDTSWWSNPEGLPGHVPPEQKTPQQELADDNLAMNRTKGACGWRPGTLGYLAPPLYGAWASAPYFHNGSVPTVDQVLAASARPAIWRRQVQTIGAVSGFDSRMSAYDEQRMGWRHDVLTCEQNSLDKFMSCNPVNDRPTILEQFTGQAPPAQPSTAQSRLIFNSNIMANSNAGHEFTDVLTEQERRAIIEYLKTL